MPIREHFKGSVIAAGLAILAMTGMGIDEARAEQIDPKTRVTLQATMMDHMDFKSIGGLFEHFDPSTGSIRRLYQGNLHPMIIVAGDYYVLCTNFLNEAGEKIDVDFLVRSVDDEYRVLQTVINGHNQLAKAGRARKM